MLLPPQMDRALLGGAVALTPNQRSARHLQAAFVAGRRAQGLSTWEPARILTWTAYAGSLWLQRVVAGAETRVLLDEFQELFLWEKVLREDGAVTLGSMRALAGLCAGAHRLLYDYAAADRMRHHSPSASTDVRTFARWMDIFRTGCRRDALLPAAHLNAALAASLGKKDAVRQTAPEYVLYGFDRLLPSQMLLLKALEQSGSHVTTVDAYAEVETSAPLLLRASSPQAEMERCAEFARDTLTRNPGATVALVVPDLPGAASSIERALRTQVAPESLDIFSPESRVPWHIAEGRALPEIAMIADALRLLRWCMGPLPVPEISALLLSPYATLAASGEDGAEADAFVLRMLKLRRPELSLHETARRCRRTHEALAGRMYELSDAAKRLRGIVGFAASADAARAVLRIAGWPGTRERDSDEFQVARRWEETLDRVAALDLLQSDVDFSGFLQTLEECCAETLFARENTGTPLQVMSVTEAAGSTADVLWFLHADESTWSARRMTHPFLPWPLQQEFGMPGADVDTDAARAAEVTQRLARSAREVRFSYAAMHDDGPRRPSPLVLQLQGLRAMDAPSMQFDADAVPLLEVVEDSSDIPALPDAVVRGGVGVLKLQAACPFRAFADKRLFATEIEKRDLGLDPRDRGNLVHKALEIFWRQVGTQHRLHQISTEYTEGVNERDRLLRWSVNDAFGVEVETMEPWEAEYIQVQKQRLFSLLQRWLDYEAERPPFEVLSLEHEVKDVRVGPLRLNLRVDRVDRVAAGGEAQTVLIDYKTGSILLNSWEGDRPEEPQLPAYAVAAGLENVGAVAFASVRAGRKNLWLDGWPGRSPLLPASQRKRPEDFEEQLARWSLVIEDLARRFADGDAAVDPIEYPKTCKHCSQRLLCRLDPAALLAIEDEDDLPEEVYPG